jgi:hypothetical protein
MRKVPLEDEDFLLQPLVPPPSPLTEMEIYERVIPIVDYTLTGLQARFPNEMKELKPAANQDLLQSLLRSVGVSVSNLFDSFPNVVSKEQIRQEVKGRTTTTDYSYLILVKEGGNGISFEENRLDSRGKPVDFEGSDHWYRDRALLLTSGYAGYGIFFHPRYQHGLRFRLLGADRSGNYLVAFAQIPDEVDLVGYFKMGRQQSMLLVQGIAWIDSESFKIVHLRTDLLAPRDDRGLHRQTTEIRFADMRLVGSFRTLWLPQEVTVTIECNTLQDKRTVARNRHRYSEYRLFSVQTLETRPEIKR